MNLCYQLISGSVKRIYNMNIFYNISNFNSTGYPKRTIIFSSHTPSVQLYQCSFQENNSWDGRKHKYGTGNHGYNDIVLLELYGTKNSCNC